jgi:CubicO group peptidase (beta-lactamase class C family)
VKIKKLLIPALFVSTALALAFKRLAKAAPAKSVSKSTSFDKIDAYIEGQMRRLNIPGASLAVVEGDKIVHQRGFGRARPGGEAPTSQTPFFIGSLTKSITALALMQLVEAGKVELDAPLQRYLPWFCLADPQASARITVRHLLNQTSGLPEAAGEVVLADFDQSPGAAERQARALSTLKLKYPVGTHCEYSNINYNLLGLVIEAASGMSYPDYIQRHIFIPLGMKHSYTSQTTAKRNGLAIGYRYWFSIPIAVPDLPVPYGSLASGQLISCAEDMARYLIAHLKGGRYRDMQLLSSAGIDEMHRGAVEYVKFGISAGKYGMGWFDDNLGQTQTFSHGGNVPDFSAYMALLPELETGVVLLVNADHYGLPIVLMEVGAGVTALLAGQQPPPVRLGFLPWATRLLLLIPLLQIAGVFATLRTLGRWRREPQLRPSAGRMWGEHILLPLVPNLSLAAIFLYLRSRGLLRFLNLFTPDLAWITLICGSFAGIWTFLRTWLVLKARGVKL